MATTSKKRKRNVVLHQDSSRHDAELSTAKPTAIFRPTKGRRHTLSIALPWSIITNVKTYDMKMALAGRIARACAVFCVDEVVIFDDGQSHVEARYPSTESSQKGPAKNSRTSTTRTEEVHVLPEDEPWRAPDAFLYHVLCYLEMPPHMRRELFPQHPNLKGAGALPSLDMPHHMRADEWCQYREGVAVCQESASDSSNPYPSRKARKLNGGNKADGITALVNCGLPHPVRISLSEEVAPKTRFTLKFSTAEPPGAFPGLSAADVARLEAEAVYPSLPREEAGYYWGYSVRRCDSLSEVFTESDFPGGYDFCIGTSERGVPVSSILPSIVGDSAHATRSTSTLPDRVDHLLLVFGGVAGLEAAISFDPELTKRGVTGEMPSEVFDAWVNLVPGQGSRTIRTEEAIWVGLTSLQEYVRSLNS